MKTNATSSSVDVPDGGLAARLALLLLVTALAAPPLQAGEARFTLIAKGNLTTSSQLFVNPDAVDLPARGQSVPITNSFGFGAELRYRFSETNIALGISADYIRAHTSTDIAAFPSTTIRVDDGYTVVPVELTGYFVIPFSGETFGIFIGGGPGLYFGRRIYRIGDTEAGVSGNPVPGFGIHVLTGVRYRVEGPFEAVFEMKFRDLQFRSENAFASSPIRASNVLINVGTQPFSARTQTDGVVFQLGIAFSF